MVALEEVAEREARGWSGRLSRQRRCSDATVENRSRRGGIQGGIRGRAGQIVAGAGFRAQATTTLSVGPRLLPRPLTSSKGAEYHLLASPCSLLSSHGCSAQFDEVQCPKRLGWPLNLLVRWVGDCLVLPNFLIHNIRLSEASAALPSRSSHCNLEDQIFLGEMSTSREGMARPVRRQSSSSSASS
nr:uncharacterized protein LOC127330097 [Lolium perenne]